VGRLLLVLCAAGCNQAFGVEPTQAVDAPIADAIVFVQKAWSDTMMSSTGTVTFAMPVSAGDAIIVGAYIGGTTPPTLTDTLGNSYTRITGPFTDMVYGGTVYLYAAFGTRAGADSLTVTSTSAVEIELYIHELSNVGGPDGSGAGMNGTGGAADGMTSGDLHTHAANELIFGFGVTDTAEVGAGFETYSTDDDNITEGRTVGPAGTYQAKATAGFGGGWVMLGAAFAHR
jgi:hypothetical protein